MKDREAGCSSAGESVSAFSSPFKDEVAAVSSLSFKGEAAIASSSNKLVVNIV